LDFFLIFDHHNLPLKRRLEEGIYEPMTLPDIEEF